MESDTPMTDFLNDDNFSISNEENPLNNTPTLHNMDQVPSNVSTLLQLILSVLCWCLPELQSLPGFIDLSVTSD